jgi:hypothetical protein
MVQLIDEEFMRLLVDLFARLVVCVLDKSVPLLWRPMPSLLKAAFHKDANPAYVNGRVS